MKRFLKIFLIIIVIFVLMLTSCESSDTDSNYSSGGVDTSDNETTNQVVISSDRKIIYTVSYNFSITNINETIKKVNNEIITVEGYISNSSQYSDSYAYYTYKVPTDKLNEFLDFVDSLGGSTSKTINTEDVTSTYNELEAKIEVLTASRAAYIKILNENTLTTSEIIEINDKIDDLDYQIKEATLELDSLKGSLDYSTVTISYHLLTETNEAKEYWQEYGSFILSALKVVGSVILYSLPFAAVAGIILLIIFIIKKKKKNNMDKNN